MTGHRTKRQDAAASRSHGLTICCAAGSRASRSTRWSTSRQRWVAACALISKLPEPGSFALHAGADEILAPLQAVGVVGGKVTFGEATANPERAGVAAGCGNLQDVERPHLDIGDASGQRLTGLHQQIHRRRAENQEPGLPSVPASAIDNAAHCGK